VNDLDLGKFVLQLYMMVGFLVLRLVFEFLPGLTQIELPTITDSGSCTSESQKSGRNMDSRGNRGIGSSRFVSA